MEEIKYRDWAAEIERLRPTQHHNAAQFTKDMDELLRALRDPMPGRCPASWRAISDEFRDRGWSPHHPDTLRKRYVALTRPEAPRMPQDERK